MIFDDDYSSVPYSGNIEEFIDYIIIYPNTVIDINENTRSDITIHVFDPNGREINNDAYFIDNSNINTTQNNETKPQWPSYVLQQWSNMRLSVDKSNWGKNNSDYNNRPELGQYKIVCCYTSNPEIYSVISLNTRLMTYPWMKKHYNSIHGIGILINLLEKYLLQMVIVAIIIIMIVVQLILVT